MLEQVLGSRRRSARAFAFEIDGPPPARLPEVPAHEVVVQFDHLRASDVTVVTPLYNYAGFVTEALDSVVAQTAKDIDLVVVDDASTDESLAVAREWIETNAYRFNRVVLIRNLENSGLALTRNVGFANAETPYVLPLDADNRLLPDCAERLLAAVRETGAAYAYPYIRQFGDAGLMANDAPLGLTPYDAGRFRQANFVDAMALVRRAAWVAVGGYDHIQFGWEDFDFWAKLAERAEFGQQVPEVLAEYRVHASSMLRSETDLRRNKALLIADIERRHPWLHVDRDPPPAE
jgi:glycosyltransferase involved in cell wall biosynthesis